MKDSPLDKKPNENGTGAPEFTEQQYRKWFDEMAPFFKLGLTLSAAIEDAGLKKHRPVLYKKASLKDWFLDEMQTLQSYPGKLANNILVRRLMQVDDKIKQGLPIDDEELKDVRFVAEKHRTSQPYFVNRMETKEAKEDDLGKVIDTLNNDDDVTERVTQPVVATDAPVQNQEQRGPDSDVQA